jgi:hypothetical protein
MSRPIGKWWGADGKVIQFLIIYRPLAGNETPLFKSGNPGLRGENPERRFTSRLKELQSRPLRGCNFFIYSWKFFRRD